MFTIPSFTTLLASSGKLVDSYKATRKILDDQRLFASLRPPTDNPERINDAECIQSLAKYVFENKFRYSLLDPSFIGKDYAREIAPYLKDVISGAMLLELIKITNTYSSEETVFTNSALGQIILNLFNIKKLSDITPDQRNKCLSSFSSFLDNVDEPQAGWHKTISKDDLKQQISGELVKLSPQCI